VTDANGKSETKRQRIPFDTNYLFADYNWRHSQVIIREKEVMALIDEIKGKNFL